MTTTHINHATTTPIASTNSAIVRRSVDDILNHGRFVARGNAELESSGALLTGDAARLTGAGSVGLVAGDDGAEVLIWTTGPMQ